MTTQPAMPSINWDAQISLRHLVESMPIAVVIVDSQGRIVYVNAKLVEMFGYSPDELFGQTIEVLIPERYRSIHAQHRLGYMGQPHIRLMGSGMDLSGLRKDGSEFPLEAGLSSLQLDGETFVVTTVTDVSKRKEVEQMLARQVEERTLEVERRQKVAESIRSILSTLIANRSLLDSLDLIATESMRLIAADFCVIYSRDEHTGDLESQTIRGTLSRELEERIVQRINRERHIFHEPLVLAPGVEPLRAFDYAIPAVEPNLIETQPLCLTIPVRGSQIYGLLLLGYSQPDKLHVQDVDLAIRMADLTVLAFANAHLRAQIEHSAVAAERSRIARDLHDAVTQTLFSASIIAGVLPSIWQRNQEEGLRRLDELQELTRGALAEMRTLLLELRPAKLVEVDLADLVRQLAEAISGRARVPVSVHVEGSSDVSADVKVALYRVAQEALNNIAKHSQARSAHIWLYRSPEEVTLRVEDDGVGFAFERIAPQHLGLGIMRERADAIGASLQVRSAPGKGTTIEVRWTNHDPARHHSAEPSSNGGS